MATKPASPQAARIFARAVRDQRRSLPAWAAATAALGALYASFYPQLADGAMADMMADFPGPLRDAFRLDDLSSAAGYLGSSIFGLLLPLLMVVYAIATGTRAIAGDEEDGLLDVPLAHPVARTRLLGQRFAALATGTAVIAATVFLAMLAVRGAAELESVSVAEFAAQCLNLALLGCCFGALAVGLGGALGRRTPVLAGTAAVAVVTYVFDRFSGQLGADWLRHLSPFHHYLGGEPLRTGFQWADAGILLGASLVPLAAGAARFANRDLGT
ncbi:ABC-2 type transport system permease protein [Prauserella shujinwangii]|uniref:ABC-2 type transport system permease protein n=1 Tax=Prauserella shujinwangii TaxID=1453103 RepID=A0A2T0M3H2_9PSEU|nr:ABC transporter permease subunit [Prauserella shujinwangii]PRX51276.1 ABC-2 type transport system permease protein [Prauserella shujinwangii]